MSTAKRLVLSFRGRNQSSYQSGGAGGCAPTSSNSRLVSSSGGGVITPDSTHELDEIAIVSSNADPCHVKYGSGPLLVNGPRLVPGIITSSRGTSHGANSVGHHSPDQIRNTCFGDSSGRLDANSSSILISSSPPIRRSALNDSSQHQHHINNHPGTHSRPHHHHHYQYFHNSTKHSCETIARGIKSVSRQSLLDLVSGKLGMSKSTRQLVSSQNYLHHYTSRDSLNYSAGAPTSYADDNITTTFNEPSHYLHHGDTTCTTTNQIQRLHAVSNAASELDLSRKTRRRDLRGRLKLPSGAAAALAAASSGGDAPLLGPPWRSGYDCSSMSAGGTNVQSTNHLNSTASSCNGTESRYGFRRGETYHSRFRTGAPNWSFVFDPAGRLCYYWSMVVSLAFLYNFWVIIYRFAFQEINGETLAVWFSLDYLSDFLYLADIVFHFRTGYLEDGVLQTDSTKLRHHYMNSTTFYIDCLCLLPLDFLYLSIGFNSILRSFRLVKIYRFWAFMDRTERHTNYPNLFRSTSLIHYLLVIFHWNGCLYHIIYKNNGFGSKDWVFRDSESADVVKQYLQSYYWCTLALTTIGDLPRPRSKGEYLFVILQLLFGLMLFATVLGHVANIVTSVSAARKEFQAKLDGVKTYMRMRRVPNHLQVKVIKWFDYLWLTQKCSDEEKAVSCLPDKLKAEIAINVHLDTLKRVEIFQNTEAGFLCELVLRLRPVLFSPGDYICRKGEVGKEMYIVNRGRLQVVADNGKTVLATLKAGSYFGEISILNMGTAGKHLGNRRTASVRSVGYSDLFVLSKKDMWDVLKEYPAARVRLEAIAVKRLEKYKRAPLEKAAMGRSQSTPGLIESRGRIPLEEMWIPPIHTVPTLPSSGGGTAPPSYQHSQHSSMFSPMEMLDNNILDDDVISYHRYSGGAGGAGGTGGGGATTTSGGVVGPSDSPISVASSGAFSSIHHHHHHHHQRHGRQGSCPGGVPGTPGSISIPPSSIRCDSITGLSDGQSLGGGGDGTTPLLGSHEALEAEIKRLQEKLHIVETENAAMSMKLSNQQWDLETRIADIEMHICSGGVGASTQHLNGNSNDNSGNSNNGNGNGNNDNNGGDDQACTSSTSSLDEHERNKESVI
ncbi:uncharacterized protein LOC123292320 isoform X2 [Chrysoperla carnea]|uniref:uncharacterized protein LOC123292320 isoform X2 n=1 Tax=Chrysoperla carnea TaxID=189513 RepID=UPI001D077A85|nr:uncharacterized protein LOC123292320 isoform X2 [Chrysoperla carnea]